MSCSRPPPNTSLISDPRKGPLTLTIKGGQGRLLKVHTKHFRGLPSEIKFSQKLRRTFVLKKQQNGAEKFEVKVWKRAYCWKTKAHLNNGKGEGGGLSLDKFWYPMLFQLPFVLKFPWFGLVWYLPGIFAQGIMMEHLACPWLFPKRSQNRSFLSFLFVLALALLLPLLPNWLSDRFSELAIGKLTRSSRKRQESKCGAFAEKIGNNLRERKMEKGWRNGKSWKTATDFVPSLPGTSRASCLRLLADRQIVGGRGARPSRPGRPRRPSRLAPPPTTQGSRRDRLLWVQLEKNVSRPLRWTKAWSTTNQPRQSHTLMSRFLS